MTGSVIEEKLQTWTDEQSPHDRYASIQEKLTRGAVEVVEGHSWGMQTTVTAGRSLEKSRRKPTRLGDDGSNYLDERENLDQSTKRVGGNHGQEDQRCFFSRRSLSRPERM
jgi:hypothetical protein